jgi:hypothetical protein
MYEEKLLRAGADPLRFIDARFEPRDPVFDADEPVFGRDQRLSPRRPRRRSRRAPTAAATMVME